MEVHWKPLGIAVLQHPFLTLNRSGSSQCLDKMLLEHLATTNLSSAASYELPKSIKLPKSNCRVMIFRNVFCHLGIFLDNILSYPSITLAAILPYRSLCLLFRYKPQAQQPPSLLLLCPAVSLMGRYTFLWCRSEHCDPSTVPTVPCLLQSYTQHAFELPWFPCWCSSASSLAASPATPPGGGEVIKTAQPW